MSAADRAALDGFFKGKRGARSLLVPVADLLDDYFATKGTTLTELSTARPAGQSDIDKWLDEWLDYATSAGVADKAETPRTSCGG